MASLPPKQARFVEEYLIDLNATQAAIRAGYSPKTARVQASRMLANVNVQEALILRREEVRGPEIMTIEEALKELTRLARSDMGTYARWGPDFVSLVASDELPEGATSAVVEVTETVTRAGRSVRFRLYNKEDALNSIVKVQQWKQETADLEGRIEALEERIEELGVKASKNGKAAAYHR